MGLEFGHFSLNSPPRVASILGSVEPICLSGRTLSIDDLGALRALIAQHPDWHRTARSGRTCNI
ncbi:MAG: hypothetical protein ACYDH9_19990 [Limisphaerales bacterium]